MNVKFSRTLTTTHIFSSNGRHSIGVGHVKLSSLNSGVGYDKLTDP